MLNVSISITTAGDKKMAKKIGVLGSGSVAQTLAQGFLKHGYDVKMGTRDAQKLAEFDTKKNGKIHSRQFTGGQGG